MCITFSIAFVDWCVDVGSSCDSKSFMYVWQVNSHQLIFTLFYHSYDKHPILRSSSWIREIKFNVNVTFVYTHRFVCYSFTKTLTENLVVWKTQIGICEPWICIAQSIVFYSNHKKRSKYGVLSRTKYLYNFEHHKFEAVICLFESVLNQFNTSYAI